MADIITPTRRQRRLDTIESDIRSALQEVLFLKTTADSNVPDAIAWAESRLEYARVALKGLKGDFAS